jgi:adenine-specific DNA methylase
VFIEFSLPVEQLNKVALSEGNSKKPVYQMHKWWARRLGSVFRAIILSAFSRNDETDETIWRRFTEGTNLAGKIILDPFMGGGTTIIEGLRLGCRVIGVDINPVAWFVTKKEAEPVDLDRLDAAFHHLEHTVGRQIRQYYQTTCPKGHSAEAMYFFWIKTAACAECGKLVKLFPNYELSRRDDKNVSVCPRCWQIIETKGYTSKTKCRECGHIFDPRQGIAGRGIFRCDDCGKEQKILNAVILKGSALDTEMHAIEGYCGECGRFFKRVEVDDKLRWDQTRSEFEQKADQRLFPRQAIPAQGRSDPRPINHGYTHFWHMFNARQLLCLSLLLEEIQKLPDQNVKELLLVAFSDCLEANNMFCKYEIEWHKISVFFGLHAYHPIERPTENNVWGTKFGRGTFVKCYEKVRRAKAYCQNPYERLWDYRGRRYSQQTDGEKIAGQSSKTFEELVQTDGAMLLRCQSSEKFDFLPDKAVDAVITDPPYFDNVQYAELADFFHVWLRLVLKESYPWFNPEYSNNPNEIVKNDKIGKTTDFFNSGLRRVFTECRRVLKDDGLLVFTFHHNQTWAWEGLARLLADAGFYISATPIVRSEGKSGFHSSEGNIRYDAVFVCRKRAGNDSAELWSTLKRQILGDAARWAQRTLKADTAINGVDVFAIVMAKTIEHLSRNTIRVSNGTPPPTLGEALREMSSFVDTVVTRLPDETPKVGREYRTSFKQLSLALAESRQRFNHETIK